MGWDHFIFYIKSQAYYAAARPQIASSWTPQKFFAHTLSQVNEIAMGKPKGNLFALEIT